jgi:NitT/TauT family transport system ATP-binding protein
MIVFEQISFHYDSSPVFEHFQWTIHSGESWSVLGPSGCGKSTLLSLLAGLRLPTSGTIRIHNEPILRPRPQTGLILQDYGLLPWSTVRQNIELGLKIRRFYGADGIHAPLRQTRGPSIEFWLSRLGLDAVADHYPVQLSGGQRQRTAIARTLVLSPDLLLMDEPFSSLDAPTRESLQDLTWELITEQGLTLVLVTHSLEEAAMMGRKILLLSGPPNREIQVVDNPEAGTSGFRESRAYHQFCRDLRRSFDAVSMGDRE